MVHQVSVLHVDDEPNFAEMVGEFLTRESDQIVVETAHNADDALDLLHQQQFDCVVSDYDMPGQNGIELLETIRSEFPDFPFILYTGKGSEEIASEAISAGVTDYLQKGAGTSQYTVLANRILNAVEQHQANLDLEDREKRLSIFIDQSPLGVVEWNEDFEFVRINDQAEKILGYSESELAGHTWEKIVPESDIEDVETTVSSLLENQGGFHNINENVRKDGKRITCEWHNRVVTDQDGTIVAIFSKFQDITARKERELKLDRQRAILKAQRDSVLNGQLLVDETGQIVSYNEQFVEMWGIPEEIVESRDEAAALDYAMEKLANPEEFKEKVQYLYDHIEETSRDEIELADGRTFDRYTTPLIGDDGAYFGRLWTFRDITVRKEREQELKRQRDLLEHTEQLAGTGGWEADVQTGRQRWTDGTYAIHDLNPEGDFDPTVDAGISFYHPDDRPAIERAVERCMELGEPFEVQLRLITAEDNLRWIRASGEAIDEDGEIVRIRGAIQDITELKEDEQEIDRLNELHGTVLANIRDAVLLTDDEGRFTYVCPNVEYIFGYDRDDVIEFGNIERLLGERPVQPDELAEQGEIHNIETTIENQAGQRRQLLATVTAVDIGGGSQLYSIRDVTDQAESDQAYQKLSRRHKLALEATDTGVWEWNMETNEVAWSEALERLVGIEPGTFEGTFEAYAEHLHSKSTATIEEGIDQALESNGQFDEEFRMVRSDGEVIWVHGRGEVFTDDDGSARMLGITSDITEMKEREQVLQEEQHFIDIALNTLADIFYVLSLDGEFLRWNDELPRVTRYSDAEIKEMNPAEFFEGADIKRVQAFFEEIIENGEAVVEAELVTKDGTAIPYSSRGRRIRDPDGELVGIAGISRDISARKKHEQRLQQQKERLEEFARIVSHDLRNPLAVAAGRLELVREEYESDDIDAIARALERMNVLIEDLLTLAREGESVQDVEQVALDTLARECWQTVEQENAILDIQSDRVLTADRSRLRQVIENLLRNAIEHGGEDVSIRLGGLDDGFYLEDDGPGIPESGRAAVFEAGLSTRHDGTGYGLSIVKEIVEAHGWDIQVTEGSDGGARFEITGVEET